MPRQNKAEELKKWVSTKNLYIVSVEFKIETLNKSVNVLASGFLEAEMIAQKIYPSSLKCETIKIYENIIA